MKTRVRAKIHGRVQGVGFRPTVYRYATQLGLCGYVCNGPHGVTLEVEGEDLKVGAFFHQLTSTPPKQAVIADIQKEVCDEKGYQRFEVVESVPEGDPAAHVPPDLATCDDCVCELVAPSNRRHGYPFINCTNCGPRFTIIRDLPYDRDKTSMAEFNLCEPCAHEYHEPRDRRFHAQPNACEQCGPRLSLLHSSHSELAPKAFGAGEESLHRSDCEALPLRGLRASAHRTQGNNTREVLQHTIDLLRHGRVVAIKGLGGYHLACDATSVEAVARLRDRKHRPHKPLAVMFRDVAAVKRYCPVSEAEEAELLSAARPIVVLERRQTHSPVTLSEAKGLTIAATQRFAASISPDTATIGAFLPYTPVHHLLLRDFEALVMTSGNRTDEPIISTEDELPILLGPVADAALTHNRPIVHKCDDSVLRVINGQRQFIRRARGFVPNPIRIAKESPQVLAVGGELKNTFCLVRNGNAFLSQYMGDLKDHKTYNYFSGEIESWKQLMRIEPEAVAYDLHPLYLSTKYAGQYPSAKKIGVQHHHAHVTSVMAEHDLHEPLMGVALDGTGYGTDGTIWGGEFMVADRCNFERAAHFKTYRLPGGDKAVEEPWRMAVSVLTAEGLGDEIHQIFPAFDWQLTQKLVNTGFNSPLTSSAGRLFDAVAAILGLCAVTSYEAQAAIRLESIADPGVQEQYPFAVETDVQPWALNFGPMFHAILRERGNGVPAGTISAKFHNTIAAAIVRVCHCIREQRDLRVVALSGGVFQNVFLLRRTIDELRLRDFAVFTNTAVPLNDGGLALGQAAVAIERMNQPCV